MRHSPQCLDAVRRVGSGYVPCALDFAKDGFRQARSAGLVAIVSGRWVVTSMGRQYKGANR